MRSDISYKFQGDGSASYTATVLHAAKSLGKGLRGLGETVASSLSGTGNPRAGFTPINAAPTQIHSDSLQAGVVTILDLQVMQFVNNFNYWY